MRLLVLTAFVASVLSTGCDRQPKTLDECLLRAAQNESGAAIEQAERICREVFSDDGNGERVPSGDETTRESSQQTGTAASQATLQETLSWISQNFRSVVEDDDFLLNQRKLGFDGCDIELRKALHHKKKGGGITFGDATSSTVTVDLGSLYYPELGNTRHTTPQGGAAAALKFRTKNMQPLVHREIDVTEGGLEGVRRRMQEFRRTGNAKSAHDWSEEQETDRFTLYFERTMAARHHKAFTRAIKLCGGEPPPF